MPVYQINEPKIIKTLLQISIELVMLEGHSQPTQILKNPDKIPNDIVAIMLGDALLTVNTFIEDRKRI